MSSNLTNSANIFNDYSFHHVVRAALIEHAATADLGLDRLARQVMFDPDQVAAVATRYVADDETVSAEQNSSAVEHADVRRIVTARWADITAAMPSL